ncbi:hypothetical protein JZ751_008138 [Albula glossodonta]|uniref:G-protein coupled receptors family 1 profile domain-containing protein n=1 Tax=Albula glossodonta TaxID=121402 RepID=A0A8T2N1M1_9TELE|nr:hypothetical protein JZ751_008138 [Albula glossodonta]
MEDMPANLTVFNHTAPPDTDYNFSALIFGILLIIVIICGNLLVCLSVYTEKALKTTTNYFIVSLAVADLLLAVLVLPLFVYAETDPKGAREVSDLPPPPAARDCIRTAPPHINAPSTTDSTKDICPYHRSSIFNLCAISIDRFIAVSVPLNYNRKHVDQRQVLLLSATWVSALAVASPVIFGINNVPQRDPSQCKLEDDNYVVYSSVCSFFIPCPIMLLLYCGMFRGLRRWEEARKAKLRNTIQARTKLQRAVTLPHLTAPPPSPPPDIERDTSDVKLEELVHLSRPDCPFPGQYKDSPIQTIAYPDRRYVVPPVYGPLKKKRAKINGRERKAMKVLPVVSCDISPHQMSIVTWLGYVNSALNPIIYTVFNTEFRSFFQKFLHSFCWATD